MLENTARYRVKVEPILYALSLIAGLIFILCSIFLVIHIMVFMIIKTNGLPLDPFLNTLLNTIEDSKASVFATVLFALIGYYMMFAAIKGNVRIGMRFFCVTFYPLK